MIETKQGMETALDMHDWPASENIQHFEEAVFEIAANEAFNFP